MSRPLESEEELIRHDVRAWLAEQEAKELLRFITCGSVDDGKSTLIGRLLYEIASRSSTTSSMRSKATASATARRGRRSISRCSSTGSRPSASRASRSTSPIASSRARRRKFIVADTPGHEQYTRNMVTGASTADLAVLLVDARKGVLTQTRRHSYLAQARRHPPLRAGGEQDGPGRLRPGRVRGDRRRLSHLRRAGRNRGLGRDPRLRPQRRQYHEPQRGDRLVQRADAARASRHRAARRRRRCRRSRCGCRCNGSTGPTRTSAASRGRSRRERSGRAPRCASCRRGGRPGSSASSRWTATSTRPSRASR